MPAKEHNRNKEGANMSFNTIKAIIIPTHKNNPWCHQHLIWDHLFNSITSNGLSNSIRRREFSLLKANYIDSLKKDVIFN